MPKTQFSQEFKIFLASSSSLKDERDAINGFIAAENKKLHDKGLFLNLVIWEELLHSFGKERIQNRFNEAMLDCDMVIALFFDRVGQFTLEEFEKAYASLKAGVKPKYLYVFFKKAVMDIDAIDPEEIRKIHELKKRIQGEEQIYSTYDSIADLQNQIKNQFDLIPEIKKASQTTATPKIIPSDSLHKFDKYLDAAYTEHRHLPLTGFVTNIRASIDIKNIYVNMRAHIHATTFDYTVDGLRRLKAWEEREQISDLDLKAAIKAAEVRGIKDLVILGNPGSGKTTLLKYILISLKEGKAEEKTGLRDGIIPFFAPLRELRDPKHEDFISFIFKQSRLKDHGISSNDFKRLLDSRQAVFLLDGVDEVADAAMRIETCRWIDRARKIHTGTPFIVTSRYAGYFGESRLEGNLLELGIQEFTIEEIGRFLHYWFTAIELLLHAGEDEAHWRSEAERETTELLENIEKNPHVHKLATNPLMLRIIACIRKDRGNILPERRVELYQECVNVFLERWDLAKKMPVAFRASEARMLLQPLALWLHEKEGRRSAPIDEVIEIIKKPLEKMNKADVDPRKLLLNIRDRSGIFMGYNETEFGFTHLSFQEYLAAEEIRNRVTGNADAIDILVKNYGNRWWREVTLLSLALDNPSILDRFIECIVCQPVFETDPAIVSDAIKEAVSKSLEILQNALNDEMISNAAKENIHRILRENGKEPSIVNAGIEEKTQMVDSITTRGVASEKPARIKSEKDNSEMVLVPAGTFLYGSREDDPEAYSQEKPQQSLYLPDFYIDAYPVTNERYCRFLNEVKPDKKLLEQWVGIGGKGFKEKNRLLLKGNKFSVEKGKENHPAIMVSWFGAEAYAKWAGKRLPSEVEWEKAARGNDGRKYPWGNDWDPKRCNCEEKYGGTTQVSNFKNGISPFGCHDMAGNVLEWCSDWFSENNQRDPKEPLNGPDTGSRRVLRGGSWGSGARGCRCASRRWFVPGNRDFDVGFRVVFIP